MSTELDKICRICMQSAPIMLPLFDEQPGDPETKMNTADMITACTIYKVDRFDELPHLGCGPCVADARQAYRFKRKCEQSHRKLLDLLGKSQNVRSTGEEKATQTEPSTMDQSSDDQNESLHFLEKVLLADGHTKRETEEEPTAGKEGFIEVLLDANEMQGVEEEAIEDILAPTYKELISPKAKESSPPPLCEGEQPAERSSATRNKSPRKHHACQICRKTFTTKMYLQRHLAIHERKRYVCKECSSSYLTKDELAHHITANGHDKPLLCPECGLRCKTSNILMIHMRRHNGEKPFKCKFCSKGFPRMDDVRVHEKYHTNEKSHFCETCGKGFQRKYNLTIHRRVHTGERPYKCPHCTQAFAQGNDLKAHIRRHTGERFGCEICAATFLQGYQMRQHKWELHGIRETPPTQRVKKFTSPEEQAEQIKQNSQRASGCLADVGS